MRHSLRAQLLAVAVLGVLTCGLALYALGRPLTMANTQRFERAHDGVVAEVQRLRTAPEAGPAYPVSTMFGMRSGVVAPGQSFDAMHPALDPEAHALLVDAAAEAGGSDDIVEKDRGVDEGNLFVAVASAGGGRTAWAAYVMKPPKWTPVLRIVGLLLGFTSFALVLAALYAVGSVQRGASMLVESLDALGRNLKAPVARPAVHELRLIGERIEVLAGQLSDAQTALAERERLAVLGRVTAGVAHELRNPLAAIKLRIDMVRKSPETSSDVAGELAIAVDEMERLDRLVNDLLTVAGRRAGPRAEVELAAFTRRRASLMDGLLDAQGVRVVVTGEAAVSVDGDAVARMVDNLLRNAAEASPRDATVNIEAKTTEGGARLRVIDRGPGVPEDRKDELFEPFFTTKPQGVGLGLALSRAIVAAHGGALTYAREGSMTVFEVFFPKGEASP